MITRYSPSLTEDCGDWAPFMQPDNEHGDYVSYADYLALRQRFFSDLKNCHVALADVCIEKKGNVPPMIDYARMVAETALKKLKEGEL